MSACCDTLNFLYLSIISGGLYISVVYFSNSSNISSISFWLVFVKFKVFYEALPKSQSLNFLLWSRTFSILMSLWAIFFWCIIKRPLGKYEWVTLTWRLPSSRRVSNVLTAFRCTLKSGRIVCRFRTTRTGSSYIGCRLPCDIGNPRAWRCSHNH